ncbi:oxidoreductase [Mycobacterium xenopi 4042]|uniref:Oxidoreductase n=1 Tax=Mycobacterium xenopi 4042 TaxID=1299334 RepID=X7Z361_MYCXE|nr:oxidoreductase [Mycobacterium xenopi 4042]EUA33839.1 oxidoreductase [Mycobacterium xenopi 3993]
MTVTTAGGGIAKRTLTKEGSHDLESFRSVVDLNLIATFNISRLAAWHMSKNEPEDEERGSSSTPRRSQRSKDRSARSPTPRPRQASRACA